MAEASEFFLIQLRIDNQTYPVNIRRDQEEIYREAERQINDKLNLYKDRFPNLAKEQYLYMTLLDLSVRLIQSERRNDTEPYESVMNNLTAEILATLGDKSRRKHFTLLRDKSKSVVFRHGAKKELNNGH